MMKIAKFLMKYKIPSMLYVFLFILFALIIINNFIEINLRYSNQVSCEPSGFWVLNKDKQLEYKLYWHTAYWKKTRGSTTPFYPTGSLSLLKQCYLDEVRHPGKCFSMSLSKKEIDNFLLNGKNIKYTYFEMANPTPGSWEDRMILWRICALFNKMDTQKSWHDVKFFQLALQLLNSNCAFRETLLESIYKCYKIPQDQNNRDLLYAVAEKGLCKAFLTEVYQLVVDAYKIHSEDQLRSPEFVEFVKFLTKNKGEFMRFYSF